MPPFPRFLAIALLLFVAAGTAHAAKITKVDVRGLDEATTENVLISLSLVDESDKEISQRRLDYLLGVAEEETREALHPFGYYSPKIEIEHTTDNNGVVVTVTVEPGEPVKVRADHIAILGEGGSDRYLKQDLAAFKPRRGDTFNHALYEASKRRLTARLGERGYFDASVESHRVEVTRADHAADIDLVWSSGERYDMGPTSFIQDPNTIIRPVLLQKLVYWKPGEYYHRGRLDRLRKSLVRLDYFSRIDIQPKPDDAVDKRVPIEVTLVPAKRSIYTAGLSYGTDSGAGVRGGMERRYVNSRGHKANVQLDYAQVRKSLILQYRIPAFAWLDGWYTFSGQAVDEHSDYIDDRRVELIAARSGEVSQDLTAVVALHALRERWYFQVADDGSGGPAIAPDYRYATFLYPELRGDYVNVDDRAFPRRGFGGRLSLTGALDKVGSNASFGQVLVSARWFKGLGERNRLIVRGELGYTFVDTLSELPPSLRFYAGGDRSIRGYQYREVGPRIDSAAGGKYSTGASNMVTASIEFEHYFNQTYGVAVFVDSGDAFNGKTPDWHTGVGIGVRYKTPIGPVRLDIARGLNNPDSAFTIGLGIGAEF